MRRRAASVLRLVLGNLFTLVLLLVLIEGTASLLLFLRAANWRAQVSERLYTTYDAELGWVSRPGVRLEGMYGRGASLTTDDRGFRGKSSVATQVPPDKRRVICSGDSFTLGFGVDDDQTWCHLLATLDPRLETVNMGQGGYGADQAYLWYRRDGTKLQHDLHVFAFITDDFQRMAVDDFYGYAKPWLALDEGQLVVRNVPVPASSYGVFSWWVRNIDQLRLLRAVQLAEGVVTRLRGRNTQPGATREVSTPAQTREVLAVMLADLKRLNEERRSQLVLVHLPTIYELRSDGPREWIAYLEDQSRRLNIPYVNLFEPFRKFPEARWTTFFLKRGELAYPAAAGHLNVEGNMMVATLIEKAIATVLDEPALHR
jgi:hypothetical protein